MISGVIGGGGSMIGCLRLGGGRGELCTVTRVRVSFASVLAFGFAFVGLERFLLY